MTISGSRVQPFYCPYCGEEDFVPTDDPGPSDAGATAGGGFHCRSCDRRFTVQFLGLGAGEPAGEPGGRG